MEPLTQAADAPPPPAEYQLPKSGLTLAGTRLTRRLEKGEVVAVFELADMTGIEFRTTRDASIVVFGVGLLAAAGGFAFLGRTSVWGWIGAGVCGCLAAACLLGARQHSLAFTVAKNSLSFPLQDDEGDARAFVLMLQQTQRRPRR